MINNFALQSKMFKKLYHKLLSFIFYQRLNRWFYAPRSFVVDLQPYIAAKKWQYLPIYPNLHSNYSNTYLQKFYETCNQTPYPIKSALQIQTGEGYLVAIPHGRIWTDWGGNMAVIDSQNVLLGELSFQYDDSKGWVSIEKNRILYNKPIDFIQKYKGVLFSCVFGGGSNYNYFQWLFDTLQRLHLLQKSGLWHTIDWFYVPNLELAFQQSTLVYLGIQEDKLIDAKIVRHLTADTLIISYINRPTGHIPIWQTSFLYQFGYHLLQTNYSKPSSKVQNTPKRIFISRQDVGTRTIANHTQFNLLLEKYNFIIIELSQLDFLEQLSVFHHAEVVMSQHGAGLANIVFCSCAKYCIELYHELVINPNFASICYQKEIQHYSLSCPVAYTHTNLPDFQQPMRVPTTDLEHILQLIT